MNEIEIPRGAVGRPGMVAMLKRLPEAMCGRLVVVREPAGFLSTMIGSPKPRFAWLVRPLGEPCELDGRLAQDVYVADACLVPVSQIDPADLAALVQEIGEAHIRQSILDLREQIGAASMPFEEFEAFMAKAYPQIQIERALESVSAPQALREIGFVPETIDGETLIWAGVHAGTELRFIATPNMFFGWKLIATCHKAREAMWHEIILPPEAPRGVFAGEVCRAWTDAFPGAKVPDVLRLGKDYLAHKSSLRQTQIQLPTLRLDPRAFRAIREWLIGDRENWGDWLDDAWVQLKHDGRMLRISHQGMEYGCPAWGVWSEPCEIRLAELAAMPSSLRRWRSFALVQFVDAVELNGWRMASRSTAETAD